jgi:hypothetical protein
MLSWLLPSWLITLALELIGAFNDPYFTDLPNLSFAAPDRKPDEVGVGSRYGGPKDTRWGGQAMACAPDRFVDGRVHTCAHRTHRCGTVLMVENARNGRRTLCRVMDRGPYGAIDAEGVWHVEIKLKAGSRRRGILDMTPAVFAAIGMRSMTPVKVWVIDVPATPLRIRPRKRRPTS